MVNDKNHLYGLEDANKDRKNTEKRKDQQQFSRFSAASSSALNTAGLEPKAPATQIDTKVQIGDPYDDTKGSVATTPQTVSFDVYGSNYTFYEVTTDVDFLFDELPTGRHITFTLDILVNQVAGVTITFSTVTNPPVLAGNDGDRYVLEFIAVNRTDPTGVNPPVQTITSINGGDGSGSQTPWASDIVAAGFDLKDLSNIEFRTPTTGSPASSIPSLWIDTSGDMVQNVATGDQFFLTVDGTTVLQVKDGETEIRSTFGSATTGPQLSILNNDSGIVVNDRVGLISFRALNSTPSETQFGSIEVEADVLTAGAEEATMNFVCVGASGAPQLTLQASSTGNGNFVGVAAGADKIIPSSDGEKECGDATHHWDDVFSETFTLRGSGGKTAGSARTIYADADSMIFNIPTGDKFIFQTNGVSGFEYDDDREVQGSSFTINAPSGKQAGLRVVGTAGILEIETGTTVNDIITIDGTGDGVQIQRTTGRKLGFFGATPVVQSPAYSVTNLTTDRSYDADATSVEELADVLGTLLADLSTLGII